MRRSRFAVMEAFAIASTATSRPVTSPFEASCHHLLPNFSASRSKQIMQRLLCIARSIRHFPWVRVLLRPCITVQVKQPRLVCSPQVQRKCVLGCVRVVRKLGLATCCAACDQVTPDIGHAIATLEDCLAQEALAVNLSRVLQRPSPQVALIL